MKNLLKILSLLLIISGCKVQQLQQSAFDPIVQKAKETSLYADGIDWDTVNKRFVELTKGKESVEARKPGLQYLINSLGDKHGSFRSAKDHSMLVWYTGKNDGEDNRDADFVSTIINDVSAKFSFQLLDNGIGYLKVVGIGPGDIQAQADDIRNGLKELKNKQVDKWILDLRYNGGGNMNPMIAGLAPLIGEGFVGGSVDLKNERRQTYKIEKGQFFDSGRQVCEMDALPEIAAHEKVAVLLSRYTISSGELVAVAFKGRANTRFIGEATAGYTTVNGYDHVTDELIMLISQAVYIDRNAQRYDENVGVDDAIEFVHSPDLKQDKQVLRAVEWLQE